VGETSIFHPTSAVMPLDIGRNSIHLWQANFDLFHREFDEFTQDKLHSFNTCFEFDIDQLRMIHQQWVVDCDDILKNGFSKTVLELSDVKMMALLVAVMSSYRFIKVLEGDLGKDTELAIEERQDFLKASELVLSFDFALNVIDWFETHNPHKKKDLVATGFDLPFSVRNDIFQTIDSHKEDRKTIVCSIFYALYKRT
jgi:hypothetical protein